jgi:hypothetical protein
MSSILLGRVEFLTHFMIKIIGKLNIKFIVLDKTSDVIHNIHIYQNTTLFSMKVYNYVPIKNKIKQVLKRQEQNKDVLILHSVYTQVPK